MIPHGVAAAISTIVKTIQNALIGLVAMILAFVSMGLEFSLRGLREAGWRPIAVFGSAVVVNLAVGLGLSVLLFRDFEV